MKYNLSDDCPVDYAHATTIPCEGETLEVGAATREITKAFFELTTTVGFRTGALPVAEYVTFCIG
jgi:hypothetical protein